MEEENLECSDCTLPLSAAELDLINLSISDISPHLFDITSNDTSKDVQIPQNSTLIGSMECGTAARAIGEKDAEPEDQQGHSCEAQDEDVVILEVLPPRKDFCRNDRDSESEMQIVYDSRDIISWKTGGYVRSAALGRRAGGGGRVGAGRHRRVPGCGGAWRAWARERAAPAGRGWRALRRAVAAADLRAVSRLVAGGADAHASDAAGRTPLHDACDMGRMDLVRALLGMDGTSGREPTATAASVGAEEAQSRSPSPPAAPAPASVASPAPQPQQLSVG